MAIALTLVISRWYISLVLLGVYLVLDYIWLRMSVGVAVYCCGGKTKDVDAPSKHRRLTGLLFEIFVGTLSGFPASIERRDTVRAFVLGTLAELGLGVLVLVEVLVARDPVLRGEELVWVSLVATVLVVAKVLLFYFCLLPSCPQSCSLLPRGVHLFSLTFQSTRQYWKAKFNGISAKDITLTTNGVKRCCQELKASETLKELWYGGLGSTRRAICAPSLRRFSGLCGVGLKPKVECVRVCRLQTESRLIELPLRLAAAIRENTYLQKLM
jgi:hypothetical protein